MTYKEKRELDRTYRIGVRVLLFAGTVAFWTVLYLIFK